jgi:hypothetical protein
MYVITKSRKMRVLEVSEKRIVFRARVSKSGQKYLVLLPRVLEDIAKKLHKTGEEIEIEIRR